MRCYQERSPCYFLYLRPFFLTGRLSLANPEYGQFPALVKHYSEGKLIDFETMLELALRESGPLVALGQPGEMIGAGRLKVPEEDWKPNFEALARGAKAIFVIPSHRTGTRWEIEWLQKEAYLSKCFFIMPPMAKESFEMDFRRRRRLGIGSCWQQAQSALADSGIDLPAYLPGGPSSSLRQTAPLSLGPKLVEVPAYEQTCGLCMQ